MNFLISAVILILLAAAIITIVRQNDIRNFNDVRNYLTAMSYNFEDCVETLVPFIGSDTTDGCKWQDSRFRDGDDPAEGETEEGEGDTGDSDIDKYWEKMDEITISEPDTDVDYDRSEWRHWTGSPCNTRQEVLIEQGDDVETGDRCRIVGGSWWDPFTGDTTEDSSSLDIDHVIALGYAAQHGGAEWDAERMEQFANDEMNLLAVSASENRSKGSSGPSEYMPPNEDFHCEYAQIWIDTADEYGLSVTDDDKSELERALNTCSS